jgi:hypothetical protein
MLLFPNKRKCDSTLNDLRQTGSLLGKKRAELKRPVLNEENLNEMGNKLKHFRREDHRCLEEEIGFSKNASTNWYEFR